MSLKKPTKHQASPKDIFLQLFATAMLYLTIIGTFVASFSLISFYLPSGESYRYPDTIHELGSVLSFPLAMLVVAFPLFVWATRAAHMRMRSIKALQKSKSRAWLSNLTLFIAAIIITVTAITVVYTFFDGALTTSTILRSLVVVAVSILTIMWYKGGEEAHTALTRKDMAIALVATVLFVALIVVSVVSMGSPKERRTVRADNATVSQLSQSFYQLSNVVTTYNIDNATSLAAFPEILQTRDTVTYTKNSDTFATFCADFLGTSQEYDDFNFRGNMVEKRGLVEPDWQHVPGENCFDIKAPSEESEEV